MSVLWGAIVGTASVIPYFYSVFFIAVLIHRCGRDFERYVPTILSCSFLAHALLRRCSVKYGKDWDRYCAVVKWKFIPGVY